jgi:hypothetical protein
MSVYSSGMVVQGADQQAVAEALQSEGRRAVVAPTVHGCTVLADRDCDHNPDAARALARSLSSRFACPAIAFHNHSDDVLSYWLYRDGEELDACDSRFM